MSLRNPEHIQLVDDVLNVIKKYNPAALKVTEQYEKLKLRFEAIESSYKLPVKNALTKELQELDDLRDDAFTGMMYLVKGNSYSDDAEISSHAETLLEHVARFGSNIQQMNYQSETTALRNIVNDWNTVPELSAAITALNLGLWKNRVATANNNFSNCFLQRAELNGNQQGERLKDIRKDINEAYYELRDLLNAHWLITNGAEPYNSVVSFINGLLEVYNESLSKRSGTTDEVPPAAEDNSVNEVK